MDTFIVYIKADDIFEDIVEGVGTRFDTSNYDLDRPLPKGKNKKPTLLIKDELSEKIMKEVLGLRVKTYSYLIDDGSKDKKPKGTKKYVIERKLKFENYKNCLEATQLESKINSLEKK